MLRILSVVVLVSMLCLGQSPRTPDIVAQHAAMQKLSFLAGKWTGSARIFRSGNQALELVQSERVQYRLDGLILEIEGVGRAKSDAKPALQALGIISYDDQRHTYHFRAFNDGRWLESDITLAEDGRGIRWGFTIGDLHTGSVLRITENGRWSEEHRITIGTAPARKLMEVDVRRTAP
jgi:hypothetical protein